MARKWFSPPELEGEPFGTAWMKMALIWGYLWGGCMVMCVFAFDLYLGRNGLAALEAFYATLLFAAAIFVMRTGNFFYHFYLGGMAIMMIFPSLSSFLSGGFFGSGARGTWSFIAPMMSVLLLPDWYTALLFAVFLGLQIFSLAVPGPFQPYSGDILPYVFAFHTTGSFVAAFAVFFVFFRKIRWQDDVLHRQEVERKEVAVKSQILNVMSHEIRTPLNAIIGLLDIVAVEPLPDQTRENVATIQHASGNLLSLVTDILDYSKIVEGRLEMERIPVDASAVLRNAVAAHRVVARHNGTRIQTGPELAQPLWVEGDPTRLAQIANNLVSNAVKFSPQGTVEVGISRERRGMTIVVRDTGVGISPEQMERLFKPFSQAEASVTRRFGGTGLGLSIVHGIVAAAGGRIEVESGREAGSEFLVHLPWPPVSAPRGVPASAALRRWRILVVDDNAVNLKVAARLLEKLGMDVACASSGEEAVVWLSENVCDLVFLDLQMPGMDGFQTADRIRQIVQWAIPMVALSAEVLDISRERLLGCGMRGFLGKPINLERLRRCLELLQTGADPVDEDSEDHALLHGFRLFPATVGAA